MRKVFAGNLRRLSAREKSHAHVARELGLNRQQFDNYLKGKNLPNESAVEKILNYFQVDLAYMFSDNKKRIGYNNLIEKHQLIIDKCIDESISAKAGELQDGLYYIIFSVLGQIGSFACSLLAVRRDGGLTTFRRVTRLRGGTGIFKSMAKDVHSGIVVYRDGAVFLVGLDLSFERSPSILVATPVASREVVYSGISLISIGSKFDFVKFCLCPIPKRTKVWKAMRNVSFLSESEMSDMFPNSRRILQV